MYFSPLPSHGTPPSQPLRAHTGTLVGDRIWFLGGVDSKNCWRGAAWFDTETLEWTALDTTGETMPPLRAHTTTLVGDKLYIFGGGDGPTYSNDVWTFDTVTRRFSRPTMARGPVPPPRRAHTTILYRNYLVVFGGGNGQAALNDVWALDVSDPSRLTWQEWRTRGDLPQKKGYHTANLVGDKMVIFGGSDGHASFADVHILNLRTSCSVGLADRQRHSHGLCSIPRSSTTDCRTPPPRLARTCSLSAVTTAKPTLRMFSYSTSVRPQMKTKGLQK
jgi:N-acetylneuraminic acid mutarotase